MTRITNIVRLRRLLAVTALSVVWACGGGVGTGGTGASATGEPNVTVGPINGFGSVIVGGVRFDDSSATVTDDGGSASGRSSLRLGQVVEIRGTVDPATSTGVASSIRQVSEVRGFVRGIDAASTSVDVGGTTVKVVAATAFDGFTSFADFRVGQLVEVYGFLNRATGSVVATRVERKTAGAGGERIKAVVIARNVDPVARRFEVGGALTGVSRLVVDYSGAELRGLTAVAEGSVVRVIASAAPVGGVLAASRIEAVGAVDLGSATWARIEGRVSRFGSLGSFDVDGVPVDGSTARIIDGTAADIALGSQVRINGQPSRGVVVAVEVRLRRIEDDSSGAGEVEVEGTIEQFTSVADFVVRSTRIDASGATFERGTAGGLGVGVKVEVKGRLGGQILRASSVEFED